MMKHCSVFLEQNMEFEKFNSFFIDFLRYNLGRMKVISTVVGREYTPNITWQISLASIYWLLYDKRFYLTVFPDRLQLYFRKPLLFCKCSRSLFETFFILSILCKQLCKSIVCSIRRSLKRCILCIIALHVDYLQKERNRFSQLNSSPKIFLGQR